MNKILYLFRSIGYNEVTAQANKVSFHALTGNVLKDGLDDHEPSQRQLPKPDLSQMIPFKPKREPYPGEHPVAGNYYTHSSGVTLVLYNVTYVYNWKHNR